MLFRASGVAPLFLGNDGLTDNQIDTLNAHLERHKKWQIETDEKAKKKLELTDKMLAEMNSLTQRLAAFNRGDIELPQGAKTYIEELVNQELYEYRVRVSNKEMDKGSLEDVENESIDIYNSVFFTDHKKLVIGDNYSELSYNNMTGHPDIVCEIEHKVKDAKSSFNKKTFPKRSSDAVNSTYEWQVRSYLYMLLKTTNNDLWRSGEYFYSLSTTPEWLVPEWEEDCLHDMTDVPMNMRVTVVPVELSDSHIAHMERRISAGLRYAEDYKNELLNKNK